MNAHNSPSTSIDFEDLRRQAREVARRAYNPYSNVQVGAALLGANGQVFTGCNVENASYGATLCAERSALAHAVSSGEQSFLALAIWASPQSLLMPCGICRQMLFEFSPNLEIVIDSKGAGPKRVTLAELLPSGVKGSDLV
jgi:cytidine deaminase